MNITINITEPAKKVQEFQEYDLGQITTTLQELLNNSSIIVDSNIIPILKVLSIDGTIKKYIIKNLSETLYNISDYITGQDLIEEDLLLISGNDQNTGVVIDTAFIEKTYAPTMLIAYDSAQPNFEIDITGNLDLTITGTVNGDSGLVNLYFSATEVATLNGEVGLSITGESVMVPIYFIHDGDGLKWYKSVAEDGEQGIQGIQGEKGDTGSVTVNGVNLVDYAKKLDVYRKENTFTAVNPIVIINNTNRLDNSALKYCIPSQFITDGTNPISRWSAYMDNEDPTRTLRFCLFTKSGDNFTLDFISEEFAAPYSGPCVFNVDDVPVTSGQYIGCIAKASDATLGFGIVRDFTTPVPNGDGFLINNPTELVGEVLEAYPMGDYAGLLINAYQKESVEVLDIVKESTSTRTRGLFATPIRDATVTTAQFYSYPNTNAIYIPTDSVVTEDGYIQKANVHLFGEDATRTVQIVSLIKDANNLFTIVELGEKIPCIEDGTNYIVADKLIRCYSGNYIGFIIESATTATNTAYANAVGSSYFYSLFDSAKEGLSFSVAVDTPLFNHVAYFIKTKSVTSADSNVAGGYVALDENKQMSFDVQPASNRWVGKKCLWVGTSIPAGGGEVAYPLLVGKMLGMSMDNSSGSSTHITLPGGGSGLALSGTIEDLDRFGSTQYSYENIIIGKNVDLLVIDHCVNDILSYLPDAFSGDISSTDRSNLYGAFNHIIQAAIIDNPTLEIVIVSPPNKYTNLAIGVTHTWENYETAVSILRNIANKYNAPFIDLSNTCGINTYNFSEYKEDGLHPTDSDRERLAYIIGNQLRNI